jgi:hypothetical protein
MRQTHRTRTTRPARKAMFLALAALLPAASQAARLEYDISLRYMHSDNITLQATDELEENILSPQLRFDFRHDTSAVTAMIRGDIQHLNYLEGVYSDDLRGEFVGDLEWTLLPERLSFVVQNTLSEQSVNSLAAFTPGNQQQVNVFEAGPTFTARFNEATRGLLDLRYTNSWAEETESFNNQRYTAAARLLRLLRDTDALLFNLEASRTDYDRISELYDFKRYDAFVTYRSQLSRLELSIDAGYSRLEPRAVDGTSSALFRGYAGWQIAPRSTLGMNLAYQFSDASQDLIMRVGAPGEQPGNPGPPIIGEPGDPNLQVIPDTFKQKRAALAYEFTGERFSLLAEPYYEQIRFLRDDEFDADNHGLTVNASYRIGQMTSLIGMIQRYERDFVSTGRRDRDTIFGAGVAMRFSRNWGAQFDLRRRERDSSIAGQEYTENILVLSITYFR